MVTELIPRFTELEGGYAVIISESGLYVHFYRQRPDGSLYDRARALPDSIIRRFLDRGIVPCVYRDSDGTWQRATVCATPIDGD